MKAGIRQRKAFTLLELLVVMGILAILLALVLRAYSTTLTQARGIQCTNNLRQLGVILHAYANDHDQWLPAPQGNNISASTTNVSWLIATQLYLNVNFPQVGQKNIFLCPAALNTFPNHLARRTYGMNAAGTDGKTALKLPAIDKPSETLLLVDTRYDGAGQGDGVGSFGINNYLTSVDWRHNSALRTLMVDGHVETIAQTNTVQLQTCVQNLMPK